MPQLSEKPRLGFATRKTAWNPGPNVCNFTVTLGLQVVVSENGVRKTYSARYYNPATGRFMGRDPNAGYLTNPASLHKYLYANGDPINLVDPTGRGASDEDEEITTSFLWKLLKISIINNAIGAPVGVQILTAFGFTGWLSCNLFTVEDTLIYVASGGKFSAGSKLPKPINYVCKAVSITTWVVQAM
jgi:RHS repeat-associated protein